MSNVIKFPGTKKSAVTPKVSPTTVASASSNNFTFTCSSCNEKNGADFHKMTFRSVEFNCSCGSAYRISNPAFAQTPKR